MAQQHPKQRRPGTGHLKPFIDSFALALRAAGRSQRTVDIYTDVVALFAGWLLHTYPDLDGWEDVDRDHVRGFLVWLQTKPAEGDPCPHWLPPRGWASDAAARPVQPTCDGYGKGYVNNVARGLQQFSHFMADEEDLPEMFDRRVKVPPAPRLDENPVPVLSAEQLNALIKDAEKSKDFANRRDAAILHLLRATGIRLAELAGLDLDDVELVERGAWVTGKANKTRKVRLDHMAARAIDRYLRVRPRHPAHQLPALWLGIRRSQRMTKSGIYQMIERRGERLGIKLHPHMFRHGFADAWLDKGGAEGDLQELMGWESTQMLQRYGRSVRSRRAQRAYDRVMGG